MPTQLALTLTQLYLIEIMSNILLKNLILQEDRSIPLTQLEFSEKINSEHAVAHEKNLKGHTIYRGLESEQSNQMYLFVQPSLYYRESRNTNNFYTALIDVLPSWKNWPKRSQSIICSNTYRGAVTYGTVYVVLPKNQAKIAICPKNDFWVSFKNIPSMDVFNYIFTGIFSNIYKFKTHNITTDSIKALFAIIDNMPKDEFLANLINDKKYAHSEYSKFKNYILEILTDGDDTWTGFFDKILNPVFNGFELQTIENYSLYGGHKKDAHREVWTDGDSVLLKDTQYIGNY
jgi:hypothetical protein